MKRQTITLLGSTGSVGLNTLQVVREHADKFSVAGLASGEKGEGIADQIREFSPRAVYLKNPEVAKKISAEFGSKLKIFTEADGMKSFSQFLDSDILVAGTSGTSALESVLEAIKSGKKIGLANKEILVVAGNLVMDLLRRHKEAKLVPIDSEHSAIFQCLEGSSAERIHKILLTGTGGPLREIPSERFLDIPKEIVINHPKWKMGKKITVDSATLMNKGLEIIEASWLFGVGVDKIEVLIHPEAIIHSMVEFEDGSVLAQLGVTDMKLPIQYALSYPERFGVPSDRRLSLKELGSLHFSAPDTQKFPCLGLAYEVARKAGSAPCVLSAADETAVGAYLEDKIRFVQISQVIEKVLSRHKHVTDPTLDQIENIHEWATQEALKVCQAL